MSDKKVLLRAMTAEAGRAMGSSVMEIQQFPFRVGRECRAAKKSFFSAERRKKSEAMPNNDLYLLENGKDENVDREHFQIASDGNGGFQIEDRGSRYGVLVNEQVIGGRRHTANGPIDDGSVLIVGKPDSPFRFTFSYG